MPETLLQVGHHDESDAESVAVGGNFPHQVARRGEIREDDLGDLVGTDGGRQVGDAGLADEADAELVVDLDRPLPGPLALQHMQIVLRIAPQIGEHPHLVQPLQFPPSHLGQIRRDAFEDLAGEQGRCPPIVEAGSRSAPRRAEKRATEAVRRATSPGRRDGARQPRRS